MYILSKFKSQLSFKWHLNLIEVCATQSWFLAHFLKQSDWCTVLKCQRNAIKCYTTPGMKICISNSTMVLSEISWEATCCQITRSPYNVILIIVIQNIKMVNDNKKIERNSHGSIGLWCFNATFNNISVLLVEETRVSIEKQTSSKSLTNFIT